MYKHILLPTDGSPASTTALQSALQFAREAGAQVTALHVLPAFHVVTYQAEIVEDSREAFMRDTAAFGAKVLAELEAAAQALGVPCKTMATRSDQPHRKIVETAQTQGCDLIAMATHGVTGLKGLLLGSETHKVLLHSTVPVLVFRAREVAP
ncbi:universal stress protein [Duganella sp. FT92W]|uniref:Universal stress protein n=1 Tax=Pseudoduganella rivuli TaxID=2666085 RepID=A0A7X2IQX6_9BURK|nr:universal stress protein [Pseudoduganella rivuli]MRV73913.1 universal stress protein [Pseudoduganella rivuli]